MKTKEVMTTIPFGGTAPAMTALIGGQVDMMCDQTTNTTAQIEGGRIKAFAVTTAQPLSGHPVLKHYPTLQEMGMKGFNLTIWHGLYAPKGTPPAITKMLNDALKKSLKDPDFIKKNEALASMPTDSGLAPRKKPLTERLFFDPQSGQLANCSLPTMPSWVRPKRCAVVSTVTAAS